jgi:hypothetical protein
MVILDAPAQNLVENGIAQSDTACHNKHVPYNGFEGSIQASSHWSLVSLGLQWINVT